MAIGQSTAQDLIARATTVGIDMNAELVRLGYGTSRTYADIMRTANAMNWAPELRTPERINARLADDLLSRVSLLNRREGDNLEALICRREQAANPAVQAVAPSGEVMASQRQVQYIHELRARRLRSGEGGGFMTADGDPAMLTRQEASAYIDSLRGEY
jgi:hypothetical protein